MDERIVRELIQPLVALLQRVELHMRVRRKMRERLLVEVHQIVKPRERLVDDVPVAGSARIAHGELHAVGSAVQAAIFAEENGLQLVVEKVVHFPQVDLVRAQREARLSVADLCGKFVELRALVADGRGERHVNGDAKNFNREHFHGAWTVAGMARMKTCFYQRWTRWM